MLAGTFKKILFSLAQMRFFVIHFRLRQTRSQFSWTFLKMIRLWVTADAIPYPSLPLPDVYPYCLVPIKMIRLWVPQDAIPSYPSLPLPDVYL